MVALAVPAVAAAAYCLPLTRPKTEAVQPEPAAATAAPASSDSAEPPSTPAPLPSSAPINPEPSAEPTSTPAPKPPVTAQKAPINTKGVEQWRELVERYSWPVEEALAVMKAESGGNPGAISPTNDHGLYQINWRWQAPRVLKAGGSLQSLYEPEFNVKMAYAIYSEQGWCPWYAARKIGVAKGCR